jgi:hypothetical protein
MHAHLGRLQPHIENLSDPSGIQAELERIRRSVTEHPDDAIGAAKQLIEATAKVVLKERGQPVSDHDDRAEVASQEPFGL